MRSTAARGPRPWLIRLLGRSVARGIPVLTIVFLLSPLVITVLGSLTSAWQRSLFAPWTLAWYRDVYQNYLQAVTLSLEIAVLTVAVTIALGVPAAYVLARYRFPGRDLLEQLILLPMMVPGIALGIALIQTHAFLRGNWLVILAGHVVYTAPFVVDTVASTIRTFNLAVLEECAATLGASWGTRFLRVVLPNLRGAVTAAAVSVFTLSMGEFNMTYILYTPLTMTLPVGLFTSYASLRLEVASAFTTIFLVLIVPLLLVIERLGMARHEELAGNV
jgi:putative spermidine/putrescine transport system permease protein